MNAIYKVLEEANKPLAQISKFIPEIKTVMDEIRPMLANSDLARLQRIQAEFSALERATKEATAFDRNIQRLLQETKPPDTVNHAHGQNDEPCHCTPVAPPVNTDMSEKMGLIVDFLVHLIIQQESGDDEEYETCTIH